MLTRLTTRNFKRFRELEVELGNAVVLIGPNNSGKTAALQALALWDVGVKRWVEKRRVGEKMPKSRPGVTINRRDLTAIPVPYAKLLWRDLHVRDVQRVEGKQNTLNVRVEMIVEGVTEGKAWKCGMEFDYANAESIYCRPLRLTEEQSPERMQVPEEATKARIAYLPPMSGLAASETRLDAGAINVRVGEGRTAEVLRNMCYQLAQDSTPNRDWKVVQNEISRLFGVTLEQPEYIPERGEITMGYQDLSGVRLDISSAGRGLHQVLLLLSYLYAHPGSVLLLDEPDAHLEILRQRQIYHLLTEAARAQGGQIIAASHSQVVLNEAAGRDIVIAFVGSPHRIDGRGSQLLKALKEIGFDQYYQAEQTGWVLYLEGSTDLAILQAFAETLQHPAARHLERPFVHYVANLPPRARSHFYGLREAQPDLAGIAIFDRLTQELHAEGPLREQMWQRREIENYLCQPEVLMAYATGGDESKSAAPLFAFAERAQRRKVMEACIADLVLPVALRNAQDPWWRETKASDGFLDRLFATYFAGLGLPNLMNKADYHVLARLVPADMVDEEIKEMLDAIVEVAESAHPRVEDE